MNYPKIFDHVTDAGRTISTMEVLNIHIKKAMTLALNDICDRHFEVKKDWQGEKFVTELRTSAQILKALKIDKKDYMFAHRKMLTAVYRSVFVEFNRTYWREEGRLIKQSESS